MKKLSEHKFWNTFEDYNSHAGRLAGELSLRWNQIETSIQNTFEKLKKLGYIYNNGEVYIIEPEKEEKHG